MDLDALQVVRDTSSRANVIDERISRNALHISSQVAEELIDLCEVFALGGGRALDDGAPTVGVGERGIADGVKDVVSDVNGRHRCFGKALNELLNSNLSLKVVLTLLANDLRYGRVHYD